MDLTTLDRAFSERQTAESRYNLAKSVGFTLNQTHIASTKPDCSYAATKGRSNAWARAAEAEGGKPDPRNGKESTFMKRNLAQYSRKDLERFVTVSTQELTRAELRVRKLLLKYHDRKTTSVGRRHRGVEVAQGAGNQKGFMCPFHGWTYDLNGGLIAAPEANHFSEYDFKKCKLVSHKVDTLSLIHICRCRRAI